MQLALKCNFFSFHHSKDDSNVGQPATKTGMGGGLQPLQSSCHHSTVPARAAYERIAVTVTGTRHQFLTCSSPWPVGTGHSLLTPCYRSIQPTYQLSHTPTSPLLPLYNHATRQPTSSLNKPTSQPIEAQHSLLLLHMIVSVRQVPFQLPTNTKAANAYYLMRQILSKNKAKLTHSILKNKGNKVQKTNHTYTAL